MTFQPSAHTKSAHCKIRSQPRSLEIQSKSHTIDQLVHVPTSEPLRFARNPSLLRGLCQEIEPFRVGCLLEDIETCVMCQPDFLTVLTLRYKVRGFAGAGAGAGAGSGYSCGS
jgi:hypothetical protein